ncbi:MAG: hypothetical protein FJ387_15950 [Verrucomicrobia bacterium]|nr:hypothetical protein [Verrucomicrobiota bacterium]
MSIESSAPRHCPRCGAQVPAGAPPGVCPQCELKGALEVWTAPASGTPSGEETGAVEDLAAPLRHFGDYELLEEIARGGMGVVYRARQRSLDRIVAVKMLLSGPLASREFIQRFRTEAAAAASLQHPNIVAIHEVGFQAEQHFFAMDFIAGRTLAEAIGQQPLAPKRAAAILQTVAEAVHHAHEHGILHRDLKPSNVILDAEDQPHVTDFGLAKRLTDQTEVTLSAQTLGSPNYMPPEQAATDRGKISRRSDVYALGAMLYHSLTGRPPFVGGTLAETLQALLNTEPVRPRLLTPSVPADLETICLKCLEKDSARRYRTAKELADELARFLNGEPILARPISPAERVWRWCRRKPGLAVFGAATALLLLTVGIGSPIAAYRIDRARQLAEARAYASDMRAAQIALAENNLGRTHELLRRYLPQTGREDLRDFAWRYLWEASRSDEQRSFQHPGCVYCAVLSPDGRWLATASFGARVRVWDLATGKVVAEFAGIWFDGVWSVCLAFTHDGRHLVIGGMSVSVVEVGSWTVRRQLPCASAALATSRQAPVLAVAVGELITGTARLKSSAVEVWDTERWTSFSLPAKIPSAANPYITVSADGRFLAVSCSDMKHAEVWDVSARKLLRELPSAEGIFSLALSPEGRWLAVGARGCDLALWDVAAGTLMAKAEFPSKGLYGLAFSGDGRVLAGASDQQLLLLWELDTATPGQAKLRPLPPRRGHENELWSVAFSHDDRTLVTASKDGTAKLWDARATSRRSATFPRSECARQWFSPESDVLWTRSEQGETVLRNLTNGVPIPGMKLPPESRWQVPPALAPGRLLVNAGNGTVRVWDTTTGRALKSWPLGRSSVQVAALSADKARAALWVAEEQRFLVWNLAREELEADLKDGAPYSDAGVAAFSPDGRWLAYASTNYVAKLWNVRSRRLAPFAARHPWFVNGLRFSPDSRRLATSCWDGTVWVWDVATGREVLALTRGHLHSTTAAAYTPDSRTIITDGDLDGLRVWSAITGQEMLALKGQLDTPFAVSPDGNWFLTRPAESPEAIQINPLPTLREIDAELAQGP